MKLFIIERASGEPIKSDKFTVAHKKGIKKNIYKYQDHYESYPSFDDYVEFFQKNHSQDANYQLDIDYQNKTVAIEYPIEYYEIQINSLEDLNLLYEEFGAFVYNAYDQENFILIYDDCIE